MGCDIHCFAEKRNKETGKWEIVRDRFTLDNYDKEYYNKEKGDQPFNWRSYSMFAFLGGVRNYDRCEPLSHLRGLPKDVSYEIKGEHEYWFDDAHSTSYLTSKELLDFDYDKSKWSESETVEQYNKKHTTYRDMLSDMFFVHLNELKEIGDPEDVRIVFWFDN